MLNINAIWKEMEKPDSYHKIVNGKTVAIQGCCAENDHTYCHTCFKPIHDNEIDQKGCDRIGLIEATCRKCIKEWEKCNI